MRRKPSDSSVFVRLVNNKDSEEKTSEGLRRSAHQELRLSEHRLPLRRNVVSLAVNFIVVDRHWFLTWTTYGTWLPGDRRGFVGEAVDDSGKLVEHNRFGTPTAPPNPQWREAAERNLKSPPVVFSVPQAKALLEQFHETANFRGWLLIAVGIMRTHLHVVVGVPGDPDPEKILGDFKAYGTRRLNRDGKNPKNDAWWTTGGSKRKLADDHAIEAAVEYIRQQANPLLIWTRESGLLV